MKFSRTPRTGRGRIFGLLLVVLTAVAGFSLAVAPSGAWFSDSKPVTAQAKTGYAQIDLTDSTNAGTCKLDFGVINPNGQAQAACKVTNNGTVPLNITLGDITAPSVNTPGTADLSKLKMSVDGLLGWTPITSLSAPVNLGNLPVGGSHTYQIRVRLDSSAGNEWANATLTANARITGTQSS